MATAETCWLGASAGATATVLATVTVFPEIDSTLTLLSARFDERQISGAIDGHARRLLAGLHGCNHSRRRGRQIDDIDFIVRYVLQVVAILDHVDRAGHQRELIVRCNREIGRRPDNRILNRQIGYGAAHRP